VTSRCLTGTNPHGEAQSLQKSWTKEREARGCDSWLEFLAILGILIVSFPCHKPREEFSVCARSSSSVHPGG
jgi:hypothetical protein